ncbi:hypothetical protein B5X24_HaOG208759 [Helicoverpa armigera]|uniref:Uncharacterized protein n=1 Tax=Helicoverpa armigera TaxID=29058 RepID=A0A2W1BQ55_HELAM|nr:hypothetical protein B5X24_HaOG208759 [Helicoverpa armigera]
MELETLDLIKYSHLNKKKESNKSTNGDPLRVLPLTAPGLPITKQLYRRDFIHSPGPVHFVHSNGGERTSYVPLDPPGPVGESNYLFREYTQHFCALKL